MIEFKMQVTEDEMEDAILSFAGSTAYQNLDGMLVIKSACNSQDDNAFFTGVDSIPALIQILSLIYKYRNIGD